MTDLMEIDGSILEGGGQILRISIALSALLCRPVRVTRIRAGRSKPGLAAQHAKGIQLVGEMCRAKLKGVEIGSTEIEFIPQKLRGGKYIADIKTAGAITLLLQVALPCALFADSGVTLELIGGTNADMAPQIDYATEVFRPNLEKFGATFDMDLHRRGYFPKGGGRATITVNPVENLRSIKLLERGNIKRISGWSFVAGTLPMKLCYEMSDGAREELNSINRNVKIDCYKETQDMARDNCSGIILACETSTGCVMGASALGKGRKDERGPKGVGKEAGAALARDIRANTCLDCYAQDQVILFMALARGRSAVRLDQLTLHTKTAMHIAELLAKVKFEVTEHNGSVVLECEGLGFNNKNIQR